MDVGRRLPSRSPRLEIGAPLGSHAAQPQPAQVRDGR